MKIYFFYYIEQNELVSFYNSFNNYLKKIAITKGVGIRRKIVCLKKIIKAIEERDVEMTNKLLNNKPDV